jgi:hypothetical protein
MYLQGELPNARELRRLRLWGLRSLAILHKSNRRSHVEAAARSLPYFRESAIAACAAAKRATGTRNGEQET